MCKALKPLILVLASICLPPATASAADEKTCETYAKEATSEAVTKAVQLCGYSGAMWGTKAVDHYDWCIRNSAETVKAESDRRNEALGKCKRCGEYADEAASAQSINRPNERSQIVKDGLKVPPMACGYRGAAWSWDREHHARWCASVSDDEARRETERRKGFTDICATCRDFAHKAAVTYLNVWSKCKSFWSSEKMSSSDWSIDHNYHFEWCMGLSAERRAIHLEFADTRRQRIADLCTKVSQGLTIQPAAKAESRKKVPAEAKRAATKPVTAARKGAAESDKAAATRKHTGSGSSAMDRLGGSPSPSGTASGGAGSGSRRGPSAAAQTAPASGTGSGGAAAPATSVNRNVIRGGGSEGVR